jgi:putative membrane protein
VIDYDRTNWQRTSFAFYGTVLPRILGRVGLLTGFCLLLCVLDDYVLEQFGYPLPALDQLGHTVLGVALSMLIVFRTNSSNNRYWEGRSYWGMIINTCRNLVRMGAVYAGPADDLARLVSAYVLAVKDHLRGGRDLDVLRSFLSGRVLEQVGKAGNPPALLARWLSQWVDRRLQEGRLDTQQAMEMERQICTLLDNQGGCEKIVRTPLPFVYAALIKQLLLLYLVSLPFVLVAKMGFAAPLVVAVVSLGLLGIEEAGVEIESPFGLDPNHLPVEQICETIARDVKEMASAEDA